MSVFVQLVGALAFIWGLVTLFGAATVGGALSGYGAIVGVALMVNGALVAVLGEIAWNVKKLRDFIVPKGNAPRAPGGDYRYDKNAGE